MNTLAAIITNKRITKVGDTSTRLFNLGKFLFLYSLFGALVTTLILYKIILLNNSHLYVSSFWTLYGIVVSVFLISRIPYSYLFQDNHRVTYGKIDYPSVTVIVAAKNEGDGIYRTLETCLESDYPAQLQCIAIDDGSTDNTGQEMLRAQAIYGRDKVNVISFPENKGKKEAMAAGIMTAQGEVIVFVDSDSYVEPTAIRHIVEHFMTDPTIGAVAGNTKVENKNVNLMTRMQSIQYAISFDIYKAAESVHHSVTCCPGCFSGYRKEAIAPLVNEWKSQKFLGVAGKFGDDRSLTNFVLKKWGVVYCEKARATTLVPEKFSIYWKQQLRWKKSWIREGILAGFFMWKNRNPLASLGFYIHFTFPFLGPILALNVLWYSISSGNPLIFIIFICGFVTIGFIFGLFVHLYRRADNFIVMPVFSVLFVTVLIWQMPYALLTVRKVHWGTR